jgi:hypothetical protein
MSAAELALFQAFLRHSRRYVEFGVGGTTVLAAAQVTEWVVSVDSSQPWIEKTRAACAGAHLQPEFHFVDIGPLTEWGFPTDPSTKSRWKFYSGGLWRHERVSQADLYFVDGRFRVACFAQVVLRCRTEAAIGFHDFGSRRHYHVVREIGREIASAEDMTFFLPRSDAQARARARELARIYEMEPA